jgi:aminoglycoside phosphotransferase family enzyme
MAQSEAFRVEELMRPAAFAHAVRDLRLKETHISWIVLTGDYAYKIKKPVHFDFIDASTLEHRRALCDEELRLNRRLAADLYLAVVPITREAGGLSIGGTGPVVEYAVRMREFTEEDELASQLSRRGELLPQLEAFGARIADFHRRAAVATVAIPYGDYEQVRGQTLENIASLRADLTAEENLRTLGRIADWTDAKVALLEPLIRLRKASGAVRECHGDLHARNIIRWQGALTAFDCLEFDPALRWIDVVSDVAFLFMDLVAHERSDLAYAFLNGYLAEGGDYEGLRLLRFYSVYRALVRAKVDALGVQHLQKQLAAELQSRLENRLRVAAELLQPTQPMLMIMNGVTASGKSRVSGELMTEFGAVRVRSDLERKRMAGVAPLAHRKFEVRTGAYDEEASNRVYARLLECSESALAAGLNVIVDAAFLNRGRRELFHAFATERRIPFLIVTCSASRAALDARLAQRAYTADDPSEATAAVLEDQLRTRNALSAHELTHAVEVRTDDPASVAAGMAAVHARLTQTAPCRIAARA